MVAGNVGGTLCYPYGTHVLGEGHGGVVAASDGVGSGEDATAGLEGGDNPCLGDRDTLLLHRLVDTGPVLVIHLCEYINIVQCVLCTHTQRSVQHTLYTTLFSIPILFTSEGEANSKTRQHSAFRTTFSHTE